MATGNNGQLNSTGITPGRWQWMHDSSSGGGLINPGDGNFYEGDVCGTGDLDGDVMWLSGNGGTWNACDLILTVSSRPKDANARLIAAAPDLLAFVRVFESEVAGMLSGIPANHEVAKKLVAFRDLARIALTEGGAL